MPIQGDRYGSQSEQQVKREYDERFQVIEKALQRFDCVAIRIDKQQHLGDLVARIKLEIQRARVIVADLTDERPSCYFETGYAEALGRPIIHIASRESVMEPGTDTKIHFDIHSNVRFFTNHEQLAEEVASAVEGNRKHLLEEPEAGDVENILSSWTRAISTRMPSTEIDGASIGTHTLRSSSHCPLDP